MLVLGVGFRKPQNSNIHSDSISTCIIVCDVSARSLPACLPCSLCISARQSRPAIAISVLEVSLARICGHQGGRGPGRQNVLTPPSVHTRIAGSWFPPSTTPRCLDDQSVTFAYVGCAFRTKVDNPVWFQVGSGLPDQQIDAGLAVTAPVETIRAWGLTL